VKTKSYKWCGRNIKNIVDGNNYICAVMPRKESLVMVPAVIQRNTEYNVIITASKNSGNGKLLVNFFVGRHNSGKFVPIDVIDDEMREYTVTVPSSNFMHNVSMCLRIFKPDNSSGSVTISAVEIDNKKIEYKQKLKNTNAEVEEKCNDIISRKKDVIVYFISRIEQRRVFKYIDVNNSNDFEHVLLAPPQREVVNSKFNVLEDYSEFLINNTIFGKGLDDFQFIINILNPKIFVCGSLPNFYQLDLPEDCKRVFVSHGLIGSHVKNIGEIKKLDEAWKGASLYCGAGNSFYDFVRFMTEEKNPNVVNNIIPQFDILYKDQDYFYKFKEKLIISGAIPEAKNYILFA